MPKNTANDAAKKKAAKEKKMLIVLALVLVVALGYAYRTLTKLHSSPTSQPVTATTPASTTASSTPAAASSPSSTSPSTSSSSSAAVGPGHLISAVAPPLDQGQLRTFTLFDSKDPFFAQGPGASGSGPSGAGRSSAGSGSQPAKTSSRPAQPASTSPSSNPTAAAPSSAVISVNETEGLVTVGGVFPSTSDPTTNDLFRLVSLTKKTAKVAIVGGSYASGAATLTLHVGRAVTLANTADGTRYTLELFPQGTVPPAAPSPTMITTTATTTTPGP